MMTANSPPPLLPVDVFLARREPLVDARAPCSGNAVEELVRSEGAQATLDVASRLVQRNLLDERVERHPAPRLHPARHRARPRVAGGERERRVLELRVQLAEVCAADAQVHVRVEELAGLEAAHVQLAG